MKETTKRRTIAALVTGSFVALAGLVVLKKKTAVTETSGNQAEAPTQLSLRDWKQALIGTKNAFGNKNLPMLAAGVAYFSTLSFFPMLAAAVAIAAFIITPDQIHKVITGLEAYLPADMASLVTTQLKTLAGQKTGNIIVAVIAIAFSLFGASGAISNLITATNITYSRKESRGFIALKVLSLILTIGAILSIFLIVGLLAVNGATLGPLHLPSVVVASLLTIRWILVVLLVSVGLAVFYRYGPDRENPKWQWVSWGAVLATIVWLLGTILFFIYAQHFANFSKSYSLFAGIIVLMTWFNLSAFIVLLGAEINHNLEKQTSQNTEEAK